MKKASFARTCTKKPNRMIETPQIDQIFDISNPEP